MTALNIIALLISLALSYHYLNGVPMPGCNGEGACEQVLSSQWSMIAGKIPVSGLAAGAYLALLIAGFSGGSPTADPGVKRIAQTALLLLAGAITGMALWFTILQKWIIGSFCPYCMAAHTAGVLLSALIIWRARMEAPRSWRFLKPAGLGLLSAALLATSQAVFSPPAIYSNGHAQNALPATDPDAPTIGPANARYRILLLFDYQCPHCQKIHALLNDVVDRYHGELAFIACPTPLNTRCNPFIPYEEDAFRNSCEIARISLALWLAKHEALAAFDRWIFTPEPGAEWQPPSLEAVREKAAGLVGDARLEAALSSPWIDSYLQTCTTIYGQTMQHANGGVPKLVFGSRWVVPEAENAPALEKIVREMLGVGKR
jgi:uncharacterized membrane protein/protein-disulfide isomerase